MVIEFEGKEYTFTHVKTISIAPRGVYINGAIAVKSLSYTPPED
jgi:hypothetical protein